MATMIENLVLAGAIAAIGIPVIQKYAGERTSQTLRANRGRLVGFLAQNRKQNVPNAWFTKETPPNEKPPRRERPPREEPPTAENPTPSSGPDGTPPFPRDTAENDGGNAPPPPTLPTGKNPGAPPGFFPEDPNSDSYAPRYGSVQDSHFVSALGEKPSPSRADSEASRAAESSPNGEAKEGSTSASVSGREARLANKKAKTLAELEARNRNGTGRSGAAAGDGTAGDFDWWLIFRLLIVALIIVTLIWFLLADMRRRGN